MFYIFEQACFRNDRDPRSLQADKIDTDQTVQMRRLI